MLDTKDNLKETIKTWSDLTKEFGITNEEINSPKYDYLDNENEKINLKN